MESLDVYDEMVPSGYRRAATTDLVDAGRPYFTSMQADRSPHRARAGTLRVHGRPSRPSKEARRVCGTAQPEHDKVGRHGVEMVARRVPDKRSSSLRMAWKLETM